MGANQYFIHNGKNEIWHDNYCFDLAHHDSKVKLWQCHGKGGAQKWTHNNDDGVIKHELHNMCLEGNVREILSRKCDLENLNQIWEFQTYPVDKIPLDDETGTW